jgi:hypothetical protein
MLTSWFPKRSPSGNPAIPMTLPPGRSTTSPRTRSGGRVKFSRCCWLRVSRAGWT